MAERKIKKRKPYEYGADHFMTPDIMEAETQHGGNFGRDFSHGVQNLRQDTAPSQFNRDALVGLVAGMANPLDDPQAGLRNVMQARQRAMGRQQQERQLADERDYDMFRLGEDRQYNENMRDEQRGYEADLLQEALKRQQEADEKVHLMQPPKNIPGFGTYTPTPEGWEYVAGSGPEPTPPKPGDWRSLPYAPGTRVRQTPEGGEEYQKVPEEYMPKEPQKKQRKIGVKEIGNFVNYATPYLSNLIPESEDGGFEEGQWISEQDIGKMVDEIQQLEDLTDEQADKVGKQLENIYNRFVIKEK